MDAQPVEDGVHLEHGLVVDTVEQQLVVDKEPSRVAGDEAFQPMDVSNVNVDTMKQTASVKAGDVMMRMDEGSSSEGGALEDTRFPRSTGGEGRVQLVGLSHSDSIDSLNSMPPTSNMGEEDEEMKEKKRFMMFTRVLMK